MYEITIKHYYEISHHIPLTKVAHAIAMLRTTSNGKYDFHKPSYKSHLNIVTNQLEDEVRNGSLKAFDELIVCGGENFIAGKASPLAALNKWGEIMGYKFIVVDEDGKVKSKIADDGFRSVWVDGYKDERNNATKPIESVNTPKSLTKGAILSVRWPLSSNKYTQSSLERSLRDLPKWIMDARVNKAPKRGSRISATWNPAIIAICLMDRKYAKKEQLDTFIKKHFSDWFEEWDSYNQ